MLTKISRSGKIYLKNWEIIATEYQKKSTKTEVQNVIKIK